VQSLWLPWIILGLPLAAIVMRMMRASLAEAFEEDFVRTARGKGLSPGRVMRRHAIPAAGAPVISLVGVTMGTVITNAILLEYTFSIPGMFSLMTQALGNADLPVIMGSPSQAPCSWRSPTSWPTSCTRGWTRACARASRKSSGRCSGRSAGAAPVRGQSPGERSPQPRGRARWTLSCPEVAGRPLGRTAHPKATTGARAVVRAHRPLRPGA
jgi:hypothetical protein